MIIKHATRTEPAITAIDSVPTETEATEFAKSFFDAVPDAKGKINPV